MLSLSGNIGIYTYLTKFSTIYWHIPIYLITFAPMKDRTKILASLFRKWRKEKNITYYQIKKEEGDSIRVDQLARIEKGQEVTTKKLLACIHFCNVHGYDILADVWNYKETPSPNKKNSDEQPLEISPSEHPMDGAQDFKKGTENTSTERDINEVPEEEYREPSESERAEWDYGYAQMKFNEGNQLDIEDQLQFIRNGRCPKCGKPQLAEKISRNGNTYTKCQNYGCGYWFWGTIHNPILIDEYKKGVTPIGSN